MPLNVSLVRRQFPALSHPIDGNPLIYLDSAATAQKPQVVLDRMNQFYKEENGNPHRGMHVLAERATIAYEDSRKTVQTFINAAHPEEIIFTKSCTESINLVVRSWGRANLHKGDTVLLSVLEHHSNVVPWLQLKEEIGIDIQWIDCDDSGHLQFDHFFDLMDNGGVCLVAVTAQSNVVGTRPPLKDIITKAHEHGAVVLVDAAQSIAHHQTDVLDLDCDFLTFSGHKLYGPTGIGILYGKRGLLQAMPPFLGGGMMIQEVRQDGFTAADLPQKFEAGTPPVAEAVGLGAVIEWLSQFSWNDIEMHEQMLIGTAVETLGSIPHVTILGSVVSGYEFRVSSSSRNPQPPSTRLGTGSTRNFVSGCVSFTIPGIHPHDLTEILGRKGICLRAGHHCAQPLHKRLGVTASTRLSVGIYNTEEEILKIIPVLKEAIAMLRR